LQNPDIVIVNGEKYQVLAHKELFYDKIKLEMDMCIELTSATNPQISAAARLIYVRERPSDVKFYVYDENVDRFLESKLDYCEIKLLD